MRFKFLLLSLLIILKVHAQKNHGLRIYGSVPDFSAGIEFKKQLGTHYLEPFLYVSSGYYLSTRTTGNSTFPIRTHFGPKDQFLPYALYGIRYYWPSEVFNKNLKPFIVLGRRSEHNSDFLLGAGGLYTFNNRLALFVACHNGFLFGRKNVWLNGRNKGLYINQSSIIGLRYYFYYGKNSPSIKEF
ncbi:MAG: hypothetical protein KDC92_08045 [Bacteroidetes bacterium]|nr:hypothetical protein [Bacteroidota bacterium]